jgi:carboxymethylenebutenolidase
MGKDIKFQKDGVEIMGYFSVPRKRAPAVIVLHEWWGLNEQIKGVADRLSKEGFSVLGLDLYKGKVVDNPNDAGQLMTDMFQNRLEEVSNTFKVAVDYLKSLDKVSPKKVGVIGFCCGGTLTMYFASIFSDILDVACPFYGLPQLAPIKPENIKIPIFFILAEKDEFVNNDDVIELAKKVWRNGVEVQLKVYPGVNHAFLNEKRPEVYHEPSAKDAWAMMVNFLKKHLGSE